MPSDLAVDFFAGCMGGAAGVLAGHPLDTIKVRLQMQSMHNPQYRGIIHCFVQIAKKENVRGFYKGLSSPLASVAMINAVIFGVHGHVVKQFENQSSLLTHFVAGACAGSAQAFIAAPMELLKLRVQLQTGANATITPYTCLRHILKEEGARTMFRGMLATHLRDCPAMGVYFASYEYLARRMSKDGTFESLTSGQLLLAGGLAGMLSWFSNYPIDVVKTRFQADNTHRSYLEVITKSYMEGGARGFFVGFGSTLIRAFPTNAATFFTVEWTYRLLVHFNLLNFAPKPNLEPIAIDASQLLTIKTPLTTTTIPIIATGKPQLINQRRRSINEGMVSKIWQRKSFLLPEAGSTLLEPFLGTI